jgi:hypothetical protein
MADVRFGSDPACRHHCWIFKLATCYAALNSRILPRPDFESSQPVAGTCAVEHEQLQEKRFFDKAMGANGDPDKVAMDKSGTNKAAIDSIKDGLAMPILMRQVKYLNNIVEQDHRAIKPATRPILNFKSFRSAGSVLASIELMHMIRKGQFAMDGAEAMSIANQFSALAEMVRQV